MPGFGSDPFGQQPFGEWPWSRQVLYDLIPELHRNNDPDGLLELQAESLREQFDRSRRLIRNFADLRDASVVRTAYTFRTRLRLGPVLVRQGEVEQKGIRGQVDALDQFIATDARFRETDVGKELRIFGSTVVGNNRCVRIIRRISLSTVLTAPTLATDAGSLRWEIREFVASPDDHVVVEVRGGDVSLIGPGQILSDGLAEVTVIQRQIFSRLGRLAFATEREGDDGAIDGALLFSSTKANFTSDDVGKWLSLNDSAHPQNNNKFEITDIDMTPSPPAVTLAGYMAADTALVWALLPRATLALEGRAIPDGVVLQEGIDLALTGGGSAVVTSSLAVFSADDVGRWMRILGSAASPRQDGEFQISGVTDANTAELATTFASAETSLFWEVRARTNTGETERLGSDAEITELDTPSANQHTVQAPSAAFVPTDVGLSLTLSNSAFSGNNATFVILAVADDETVTISGTGLTLDEGPLNWQVVSGVFTKVDVRQESALKFLAQDFGIEVDNQESEARQRSWVRHVNTWLDRKGHEDSYQLLAGISGFDATVIPLYRIAGSVSESIPGPSLYEVGDTVSSHSGTDGELVAGPGALHFEAATASFAVSDVGSQVRTGNAITSSNNSIFTIAEVVSTTEVRFEASAAGTADAGLPDASAPTLTWSLMRLYTSLPPSQPRFDDFNSDALHAYIEATLPAGDVLVPDGWCWEDDWAGFIELTVVSTTLLTGNRYEIQVTPPTTDLIPTHDTKVKWDLPVWELLDSAGNTFVLETRPDVTGGDWTFDVIADPAAPPGTGAGVLNYLCLEHPGCGFCKSSKLAIEIQQGSIAQEEGIAVERVLERVLRRLDLHPRPIHVELVPIFKAVLEASLTITATVDYGIELGAELLAPEQAYFDEVPGDEIAADADGLTAEVEATKAVLGGGGD